MAKSAQKKKFQPKPLSGVERLWHLAFLLLLAGIGASGLYTVNAAQQMRSLYGELGEVQRHQDALLEQRSRLMLERGALGSLQTIEKVAETQLNMQFPDHVEQVLK